MPNNKSANTVTIIERQLHVTKRKTSPYWQAYYKVDGRWFRASTGKEDFEEAKAEALEKMLDTKYRHKHGVPIATKRFRDIAKLVKQGMTDELKRGVGKVIYKDYERIIDQYLIPFFGKLNVDSIDYAKLIEFEQWRIQRMGKTPAASTINNHTAALNRIFDEAVARGYLVQSKVPRAKNKGNKAEARPTFTIEEYRDLYRFMRTWIRQGRNGKPMQMRELLRDYVLFLASTGMRHGTETHNLRWNNIRINENGYLVITITQGKTGGRQLIARSTAKRYLKRIAQRKGKTLAEILKTKDHVFTLNDGSMTTSLHQTFERLLEDAKLLVDPVTGQNRTLYSLRHFYISQSIIYEKVKLEYLAAQCGTSIAMIEKHYGHLNVLHKAEKLAS